MNQQQANAYARFFAKLSRPQNVVYSGLLSALIAFYASGSFASALFCYMFFLCIYAAAAGYNNLQDYQTDRINKRADNPLLADRPSRGVMITFFAVTVGAATLLQMGLAQPASMILAVLYVLLATGYSHPKVHMQSRGWWAGILLSICYGSLPVLLGFAQGMSVLAIKPLFLAILQIPLLFPILLAKDYKDKKGDTLTGKRTPLVRYGKRVISQAAMGTALLAAAMYVAAATHLGINLLFALPALITYLIFCYKLHRKKGQINPHARKLANVLLIAMNLLLLWNE